MQNNAQSQAKHTRQNISVGGRNNAVVWGGTHSHQRSTWVWELCRLYCFYSKNMHFKAYFGL